MNDSVAVALPTGTVHVPVAHEGDGDNGTVIVAHGAGAGMEHPFLVGFAEALRDEGFRTVRFDFAYRALGRRMPGPAPHALAAWNAVVDAVREHESGPVWAAGKSYGGRMASMAVAEGMRVDGLAYLGYPLHQPGRPDKPRAEHLPAIAVPQLFLEGTNDAFIQPLSQLEEVVATCQDARIAWVEGGGHSFEVKGQKRSASEIGASLAPVVAEFVASAASARSENSDEPA